MPVPKINTYGLAPNVLTDGSLQELQVTQLLGLILTELRTLNEMLAQDCDQLRNIEYLRTDTFNIAPTSLTNPT